MQYYVYVLIDPRNNQPFYVGKGYKNRMMSHESETRRGQYNNKEKCEIIQEIWNNGLQIKYEQIFVASDEESREREKALIKNYGRRNEGGLLTNKHVGGNGGGRIGKCVCQYDKNGTLLSEHVSASEAERKTGVSLSKITAVCRGEWKIAGGFQWKWKGEEPIKGYTRHNTLNAKPVKQYDFDGTFIAEYASMFDAVYALTGSTESSSRISACCRKHVPSYLGYQWRYSNDSPPKNIQHQKRKVGQYDLRGNKINTFDSIADAVKHTKITAISAQCNNPDKYKQAGGYVWKFE